MKNDMISSTLRDFFWIEIRNEREGGVSPATLDSAMDSFKQAPDEVRQEWTNNNAESTYKELAELIKEIGGQTELSSLTYD